MAEKTIEVWTASISAAKPCADPRCRVPIIWTQVAESGRRMCFTAPVEPVRVFRDELTNKSVSAMPFERNHWASCPGARDRFKGKPAKPKPEPEPGLF